MDLPKNAYFRCKIVPYEQAKVGVATHALNYGTAVFGGLRAFWNEKKEHLYLFRPLDHYRRFLNSCRLLLMEFDHTPESLTAITVDLLHQDGYRQNIYIRPLAYKADEQIGVRLHNLTNELTIFAMPFGQYIKNDTSAHVTFSSWRRIDDNVIPARGKISGAYVNSAFAKTDAALGGYDEALVLTQEGHLAEGSAMNVFIVRDGTLITPPVTENVLEGITRRTVIELAREELKMQVVERLIDRSEVYLCDELLLTGTAAQVTVVTQVDHRKVGKGVMGPVGTELRSQVDKIVHGEHPKYQHLVVEI